MNTSVCRSGIKTTGDDGVGEFPDVKGMFDAVSFCLPGSRGCARNGEDLVLILLDYDNCKAIVLAEATKGRKQFAIKENLSKGPGVGLPDRSGSCRADSFAMTSSCRGREGDRVDVPTAVVYDGGRESSKLSV